MLRIMLLALVLGGWLVACGGRPLPPGHAKHLDGPGHAEHAPGQQKHR